MPQPKQLSRYPESFFELAQAFATGLTELEVELGTHGKAVNFRQKFYTFRILLAEEKNPLFRGVESINLTVEGTVVRLSAATDCAIRDALAKASGATREGTRRPFVPQLPADPFTSPLAGEAPDSMEALVAHFANPSGEPSSSEGGTK